MVRSTLGAGTGDAPGSEHGKGSTPGSGDDNLRQTGEGPEELSASAIGEPGDREELAPADGPQRQRPAIKQAARMANNIRNPLTLSQLKKLKAKIEGWMPQVQLRWTADREITSFAVREIGRRIRAVPSFTGIRTDTVGVRQIIIGVQETLKKKRALRVISDRKRAQARMLRH